MPQGISFFSATVQSSNAGFTGQSYTFPVAKTKNIRGILLAHQGGFPKSCSALPQQQHHPFLRLALAALASLVTTAPIRQKSAIKLAYPKRILNLGLDALSTATRHALVHQFPTTSVQGILFGAGKSDVGPQNEMGWSVPHFQIIFCFG